MALNPLLNDFRMPVPLFNEVLLLYREQVDFEVDNLNIAQGSKISARGTVYLSNVRIVFVANKPVGDFVAFDMPLVYIQGEKFNQPIFFCNNISGRVKPVTPDSTIGEHPPHDFKIIFKEGGCGTFVPLFFQILQSARQYHEMHAAANHSTTTDRMQVGEPPVETVRKAFVDPSDPTKFFIEIQHPENQLRHRTRNGANDSI
eukprot:TRINITY_DN2621_c0_g1_i1.p1 TRINITY_DN2621_c0_g1~~TRINITY_DN2621_c0_g1_i1.p1  ORF type:complete len:228 (-),score=26.11 TRINITY_DN2621_c0_g1_i1:355-960(-)